MEVLFRGKRTDKGKEWVYGWLCKYPFGRWPLKWAIIPSEDAERGHFEFVEVDPNTVSQFTGFTDRDGNEIFPGDIVSVFETLENDEGELEEYATDYALIVFDEEEKKNVLIYEDGYSTDEINFFRSFKHYGENYGGIKVVGNIHENPELWNPTKPST